MRSSCDASATKRRNLSSLDLRAAKDSSIRESIALSEVVRRPTSVVGLASGRRAERSPAAIWAAVSSTVESGLSPTLIIVRDATAISPTMTRPIRKKSHCTRLRVRSTSLSDCPMAIEPRFDGRGRARTRKFSSPALRVNGSALSVAASVGVSPAM